MRKFGYVRTSTDKQLTDRQILALKDTCGDNIFIEDGVSAAAERRPVYDYVLSQMQSGDTLVVLSFDRVFRCVVQGLTELDKLHTRGIVLKSMTQNFDTTSPEGRLLFTIAIALGEWERKILSNRTKQGMDAARKRGVKLGRPKKSSRHQTDTALPKKDAEPDQDMYLEFDFSETLKQALNKLSDGH